MNPKRWQRVSDLFEEALKRPVKGRGGFLAETCAEDAELRTEVESLLEHHEQASPDFMRTPETGSAVLRRHAPEVSDSRIGSRFGAYHIKGIIAPGGMGTVYEAVQEAPRRVVALKVMHRNVASRSALRRFQFESQILARLRHPNIAEVFAAGMHDDGSSRVPYFAMEYIPGAKTLIEYADEKQLGTRERLALFAKVCDAVHHGHQKGIIHRDLKPANLLVDASGEPKVIDFGVARATDSDLAITTQQTNIGQLIGTMQYMSPEQCDADPHNLDTRSDVYSLGVVLYELLTGGLPYEASNRTIYQATRAIKEQVPRRLSSVNPKLRGDVETITLKALEKDRERRYQSAAGLAKDIGRFLHHEPIEAKRPSLAYVARKFVERHTWQAAALAAGSLAAVALVVAAFVWNYASAAEKARHRAEILAYGSNLGAAEAALHMNDAATARKILDQVKAESPMWEWRHLRSRVDQSLATLMRSESGRPCLAIDPSGRWLAATLQEEAGHVTKLYDIEREAVVGELPEEGRASYVAFSGDGSLLAAESAISNTVHVHRRIRLWNVDSPADPTLITEWTAADAGISALAFHPRRPVLASTGGAGTISLWDLGGLDLSYDRAPSHGEGEPPAPRLIHTLKGHLRAIGCLAFSPDGGLLASASIDRTARLWDAKAALAGKPDCEVAVLAGHTDHVICVAFSPDGKRLASASVDKTVRLWDVEASLRQAADDRQHGEVGNSCGVTIGILTGHDEGVMSVAFDSTGTRLVSGGGDTTLRVWDVDEAAVVSDSHGRRDWPVPRRRLLTTLRGHEGPVRHVGFHRDGRMVSVADGGAVKLWAADVEDVWRLREHFSSVKAVAFTPDGKFVVSAGGDAAFIVWDVERCVPVARRILRHSEMIRDLACWRNGDRVLLAAVTGFVPGPSEEPPGVGRILVSNLDVPEKPQRIAQLRSEDSREHAYFSVAVSENGTRLAAGDHAGAVVVWDIGEIRDATIVARLDGPAGYVNGLVFLDEEGDWLVSAGGAGPSSLNADPPIRLWHVPFQSEVQRYTGHDDAIRALALSPDRHTLASASGDQTVRLWSVEWTDGTASLEEGPVLKGHTEAVDVVAFHPTEPRLVSGSVDRTIKVWDTETGVEVATLRGHVRWANDLAFDSSGERLASASAGFQGSDNVARLWETGASVRVLQERAVLHRAYDAVWQAYQSAVQSPADARRRIENSDKRLPEGVRQAALERFDMFTPDPAWFYMRAWDAARDPGLTEDAYRRALVWAQAAEDAAPESGRCAGLVGLLYYRLGRYDPGLYEQALEAGQRATAIEGYYLPMVWAVTALAQHALGDTTASQAAAQRVSELMKRYTFSRHAENQVLAKEVSTLIGPPSAATADLRP